MKKNPSIQFKTVIVGALGVLLFVVFAFVFFRRSTYITAVVKIGSDSILWDGGSTKTWFSQMMYIGMKEKGAFGQPTAEIVQIRSYNTSPTRRAVYATVKLKVVYYRSSNQYHFKGKPLLVGSTVKLYLDRLLVEGLVTRVEGIPDTREKKILTVKTQLINESPVYPETSGAKKYIADAIQKGDEIRDEKGDILVKVVDKRENEARKLITTSDGRVLIRTDPDKWDVYLDLQVQAVKMYDRYYVFDDVPLLIGSSIPINTSTVTLYPEIISIDISQ